MKAKIGGRETELTVLLAINEKKTMGEKIPETLVIFVLLLIVWIIQSVIRYGGELRISIAWITTVIVPPLILFLLPSRHRFWLCKEGIYMKSALRSWLYRWDSFHYFVTHNAKKSFELKKEGMPVGSILLTSKEHFDEVKQVLSQHISPKQ